MEKNIRCDVQHIQDQVALFMAAFENADKHNDIDQARCIHLQFVGYVQALYDVGIIPEKDYIEFMDSL